MHDRGLPPPQLAAPRVGGFQYQPQFLSAAEEAVLLERIRALPFKEAPFREYTARRRIVMFEPVADFLAPMMRRVAQWAGIAPARFVHSLVTEYRPGTQLGWHRDSPEYGEVAGLSLEGFCRMRWRPYPPKTGSRKDVFVLDLEPRSAYLMRDDARWGWQHSIAPTPGLRYSVTFRTLRRA